VQARCAAMVTAVVRFELYYFLQGLILSLPSLALLDRTRQYCADDTPCVSFTTATVVVAWHMKPIMGYLVDRFQARPCCGWLQACSTGAPLGLTVACAASWGAALSLLVLMFESLEYPEVGGHRHSGYANDTEVGGHRHSGYANDTVFVSQWVALNFFVAVCDVLVDGWQTQFSQQVDETMMARLQAGVFSARCAGGGLGAVCGGILVQTSGRSTAFLATACVALFSVYAPLLLTQMETDVLIQGLTLERAQTTVESVEATAIKTCATLVLQMARQRGVSENEMDAYVETVEWALERGEEWETGDDPTVRALSDAVRATHAASHRPAIDGSLRNAVRRMCRPTVLEPAPSKELELEPEPAAEPEPEPLPASSFIARDKSRKRSQRHEERQREQDALLRQQRRSATRQRRYARVCAYMFLSGVFPSFGTAMTLFLLNRTSVDYAQLAVFEAIGSLGSAMSARLCWRHTRVSSARAVLRALTVLSAPLVMGDIAAVQGWGEGVAGMSWQSGWLPGAVLGPVVLVSSVIGGLAAPIVQQQAVRVSYKKHEALSYSVLMASSNLGGSCGTFAGGLVALGYGVSADNYENLTLMIVVLSATGFLWSMLIVSLLPTTSSLLGSYATIGTDDVNEGTSDSEDETSLETRPLCVSDTVVGASDK
jgi:hypothetical protein